MLSNIFIVNFSFKMFIETILLRTTVNTRKMKKGMKIKNENNYVEMHISIYFSL